METKEKIKEIISDNLGIDSIEFENKENPNLFHDLVFDSIDIVSVLIDCEKAFNISISDNEAEKWQTLDDIVNSCKNF